MAMTDWINACFIRGGTSKGLFFKAADRTGVEAVREVEPCTFMGLYDADGREVHGIGDGISSLSNVMLVRASMVEEFDVVYTFGQVEVAVVVIDYSENCGNLSSGVVPFAL